MVLLPPGLERNVRVLESRYHLPKSNLEAIFGARAHFVPPADRPESTSIRAKLVEKYGRQPEARESHRFMSL
jgi:hypothetical protein